MKKLLKVGASLFALAALVLAITIPTLSEVTLPSSPLPTNSDSTDFALSLFKQQTKKSKLGESTLLSPCGVRLALNMALNAAGGKTRAEMAKVLGSNDGAIARLNFANARIMQHLSEEEDAKLEIVNAIYSDNSAPLSKTFIENCQSKYHAEARNEDFSSPETVPAINSWCDNKTRAKIHTIVERLSKKDKLVLLNAVYFQGIWEKRFRMSETSDDKFATFWGPVSVKMMHQQDDLDYFKGSDFEMLSLSFFGHKQRLCIFLPNEGVDMKAFQAEITHKNFDHWMENLKPTDVALSLPRLNIEWQAELIPALQAIGMREAFNDAADLSRINNAPTPFSQVHQKTWMSFNEAGTRGESLVGWELEEATYVRDKPKVEFRVDRPFILALVDDPTNEIVFLGAIAKPN